MTSQPEPDRFAIIPIYSDSTGMNAIPQNAVAHGSWAAITGRIRDTKQQRQLLTMINDAEHAKGELKAIRDREQAVSEREQAVKEREDAMAARELRDAIAKLDATAARFDAYEAAVTRDPDDDVLPIPHDAVSGELPPSIARVTPPTPGTEPTFDPRKLAHPQEPPNQPIAIEDD
jgi:hypothetical protein